jgi:probable DNA metabolism protein
MRAEGCWRAVVAPGWDPDAWREQARRAWRAAIAPDALAWGESDAVPLLPVPDVSLAPLQRAAPRVPAELLDLAGAVSCHDDPQRHALLYRVLWRVASGERLLLTRATDPDMHRLRTLEKAVRRDAHKMKAFVRFRRVPGEEEAFVAWFEPGFRIVDRLTPFFVRRFTGMRWAILTPYRSVAWDGEQLRFGAGTTRESAPSEDAQETLWRTYYAHIFNPARVNPTMMRSEMPLKYWRNLPEASLIPDLLRTAAGATERMVERAPQPTRRRIPARG